MNYNIEDSRVFKAITEDLKEFKQLVEKQFKETRESIEVLSAINKEARTLTENDVESAWYKFAVDFLTGRKQVTSDRFKEIKLYMGNIDLNYIPQELQCYIKNIEKEEKEDE